MTEPTLESLARQAALGDKAAEEAFFLRLQDVLKLLPLDLLEWTSRVVLDHKAYAERASTSPAGRGTSDAPPLTKVPPEVLEWARQNFNEAELVANLREVREHGGLELKDFIHELEEMVAKS